MSGQPQKQQNYKQLKNCAVHLEVNQIFHINLIMTRARLFQGSVSRNGVFFSNLPRNKKDKVQNIELYSELMKHISKKE